MYGPSLTPYKGYTGSITVDFDNKLFYATVDGIPSIVEFEAGTLPELQEIFNFHVQEFLDSTKLEFKENYK